MNFFSLFRVWKVKTMKRPWNCWRPLTAQWN